jgi:hypothetical protein
MAEPPYSSDAKPPAVPRWVKVFGVVAALVVLLFVVLLITGGHGPRRHGAGGSIPPAFAMPAVQMQV